jgi:4-amino-4-deoxy-L-arabinose transferase-like glycosyltransferase
VAILLIGLAALLVRLGAIAITPDLQLTTDPRDYDRHARTIAATGHYPESNVAPAGGPSAIRPPGYPYFLGAVYALTGDSVTAGRVAQALLGALAVVLTALIALELFGRRAALIAGGLAAIFPPLVMDGMTLFTEPLFVVLVLAAVLAALRWRRDPRLGWVAAAGVATGLALLTRPNAILVLLVLAIAVLDGPWRRLRSWRAPLLLVACAVLVVAPWTIRNAVQFDRLVPISTQDGFTLAAAYNETSRQRDALWIPGNFDPALSALLERSRTLDEAALNERLRTAARRFALDHPGHVASVAGHNLLRLFNLGGSDFERAVARQQYGLGPSWATLMVWSLIPILVLAAFGAATRDARQAPRWIWALPAVLLSTIFVLAANRHRAAIDPFLLMLVALAVLAAVSRVRERSGEGPPRETATVPS